MRNIKTKTPYKNYLKEMEEVKNGDIISIDGEEEEVKEWNPKKGILKILSGKVYQVKTYSDGRINNCPIKCSLWKRPPLKNKENEILKGTFGEIKGSGCTCCPAGEFV